MPLQHGDDQMLKAMKRGGSVEQYKRLFGKMRETLPNLTLRTTFLVGFPGETDAHFAHLLDFVTEMRFDRLGVFTYSAEEGTPAFALENPVPNESHAGAAGCADGGAAEHQPSNNQKWLGRELDVLVEPGAAKMPSDARFVMPRRLTARDGQKLRRRAGDICIQARVHRRRAV